LRIVRGPAATPDLDPPAGLRERELRIVVFSALLYVTLEIGLASL